MTAAVRGATTATGGLVCLALGWAAIAVIEVVSLDEGVARVHTVFKGWFQAWWLLAVGSAVVVTVLLSGRRVRIVGCSIVALATVMAAAFAGVLVPARLHARDGVSGAGFDGMSFLRAGLTIEDNGVGFDPGDDRLLLDWLRQRDRLPDRGRGSWQRLPVDGQGRFVRRAADGDRLAVPPVPAAAG